MSLRLAVYFLTFIAILIIGLIVIANNKNKVQNRVFALFLATVNMWVLSLIFADNSSSEQIVLLASQAAYISAVLMSLSLLNFSFVFPNTNRLPSKRKLSLILILPLLLVLPVRSDLIIQSVKIEDYGANLNTGPLYIVFLIYILLYIGWAVFNIFRSLKTSRGSEKAQVQFMILGIATSAILVIITNLVLVVFGISALGFLGPPSLLIFISATAYAIVKHKLFDIRAVVARSLTYLLSIGLIVTIYSLVAFNLSNLLIKNWPVGLKETFYAILAVILAITFTPVKRFFERITNAIFYRDKYDAQQLVNNIGQIMASEIDLDKLSHKVIDMLCTQMKIEKGEIVVFGEKQLFYENNIFKKGDNSITQKELRKFGRAMGVYDLLQSGERKELMNEYSISISLPLKTGDKFMGYLLLANKKSGDIYNNEDIKVLEIIGSELSVAVQNALSYKEIQLFSETLAEKVRQRTGQLKNANDQLKILDQAKDEFISMASHQLRTPLTTVKGYASMLDEGDFGKLSKEQREPVQLALDGANRMARLIDDLLNVSRMDANRFFLEVASIDLAKVVDQEIAQLQNIAQSKGVKLNYIPPKSNIPEIRLDENKTRQVIMNLVDNAIHYSQPPKGGGEVNVSLELDGQHAVFIVKDNGIGVPEKVKNRLFTKMFRANNAKELRPDGTGLGLYLVKRVVQDEGGELIFESTEGKGSTFGFTLPLSGVPKDVEDKSRKIGAKVASTQKS